jgi:signal transduction histidine kinase/ligand-binding sensor domain-containing protein/AraC-like DNA-binding protein/AmiR/NasT family two-component response regulator
VTAELVNGEQEPGYYTLEVDNTRFIKTKMRKISFHFLLVIVNIFSLYTIQLFPQKVNPVFEHFSIDQGLSETIVKDVIQDKRGYLWISTWSGIERYDGYSFTSFKHDPGDSNSIANAFTEILYEDKSGFIWVGTWRGLEKFDRSKGIFIHYIPHPPGAGTEWSNHVTSICEDNYGILWIGTEDGLNILDRSSGKFQCFRYDSTDPGSVSDNSIGPIFEDKAGSLWIGTERGLDKFDRKSGRFIHIWYDPDNRNGLIKNRETSQYRIRTIYEVNPGILWLGTYGGLVEFNPQTGKSIVYIHDPNNQWSLSDNNITSVCKDPSGTLWVGTGNGLNAFNNRTKKFINYFHDEKDPGSLSSGSISSLLFERSGTLWISSWRGLNKLNRIKPLFTKYNHENIVSNLYNIGGLIWVCSIKGWEKFDPKTEQFIPNPFGKDYFVGVGISGDQWMNTHTGGIYKRDSYGKVTRYYDPSPGEPPRWVSCVYKTRDGKVWLATDNGLYFIDPVTNRLVLFKMLKVAINILFEDTSGLLWVGTEMGGLLCYNRVKNIMKEYISDPKFPKSISGNTVLHIHEDKKGRLWFGTNIGLNKYDPSTDKFTYFTERNGLASNAVFTILEDEHGFFWLSTRKGVSKFDPETNSFQNYDISYGLPNNGFSEGLGCKAENGEMYFGGDGLTRFHPDSIHVNPYIPFVEITALKKFDKPIAFGTENHLSYTDNFLSFEFVALSFVSSERNQYAYKMEGLDKDWIYSGSRRYASYPDLEPGKYIFRVKGSNNDGVWNEAGTSILIIISPPWWRTWWAYISYFGLFVFALYSLRRYELNRISLRNRVRVNEIILKEKDETEKMKSRFFANISHEFRTPLTLIQGPVENIISKSSEEKILKDARLIKRNSSRLLQLINQLLDLSKLEAGKLKLEASKGNIVSFVKGIALSFESLFESKDITLKFQANKEAIELYFDREKMMQIITNIISNAFKFTSEDGKITISVNKTDKNNKPGTVQIKIRDTGIGISQEEIPKLFDRFYQVDSSFTKEYEGAGIGLALTKELVELHHGSISVESKQGDTTSEGWTEFTVELPLGSDHLREEEIKNYEGKNDKLNIQIDDKNHFISDTESEKPGTESEADKNIILIVEDNYDMREYIKDSLSEEYLIEEAVNGEQGVRKAEKIIPDLIIADVMMPRMDGNELVRFVKNNEKTSHIPVILLTARSGHDDKIEGLETGADDYLTKPFDIKELQVRIKNLIMIRKRLQDKFSKMEPLPLENNPQSKEKILSGIDEKFMSKVSEVIEEHISDEDFSIEEFGSEVGMSRTQLHRKLKALTGKSASLYLRSVRLAKALIMIKANKGNISEISFNVGFSSPAYFTKCFRKEFGYPPSDLTNH